MDAGSRKVIEIEAAIGSRTKGEGEDSAFDGSQILLIEAVNASKIGIPVDEMAEI